MDEKDSLRLPHAVAALESVQCHTGCHSEQPGRSSLNFLMHCPQFIYFLLMATFGVPEKKLGAINLFNLKRLRQHLSLSMSKPVKKNSVNRLNALIQKQCGE